MNGKIARTLKHSSFHAHKFLSRGCGFEYHWYSLVVFFSILQFTHKAHLTDYTQYILNVTDMSKELGNNNCNLFQVYINVNNLRLRHEQTPLAYLKAHLFSNQGVK